MIEYATPTQAMLESVAERMADADRAEMAVISDKTPLEVLREGVDTSTESFVAVINGVPEAVFGVAPWPDAPDVGVPWLLGTRQLAANGLAISRHGRALMRKWERQYRLLFNISSVGHYAAHLWMLWLGFVPTRVFEVHGQPFITFERTSPCPA